MFLGLLLRNTVVLKLFRLATLSHTSEAPATRKNKDVPFLNRAFIYPN